ncbi:MAG: hypothetical protein LAT83_11070 [Kiritimatiellae bacterium]|nr:hypothetical protein [Kiritimatiellia bacterium]
MTSPGCARGENVKSEDHTYSATACKGRGMAPSVRILATEGEGSRTQGHSRQEETAGRATGGAQQDWATTSSKQQQPDACAAQGASPGEAFTSGTSKHINKMENIL